MLKGRESLARIVGKRRRFLPNRHSVVSPPSSESSLSLREEDGNENNCSMEVRFGWLKEDGCWKNESMEGSCVSDPAAETVKCPVCGCFFPDQDYTFINNHLDECLARGSKRKLSQLTLLQMNFAQSRVRIRSHQLDHSGCLPILSDTSTRVTFSTGHCKKESDCDEVCEDTMKESTSCCVGMNDPFKNSTEDMFSDDKFVSRPTISESSISILHDSSDDLDISKLFIPTTIVGRRYRQREELYPELKICLVRDPENLKDPNAIKVIYEDSDHNNDLGYIPREMAQYLTPLMDTFSLIFEGRITGVPKDHRASVPIQLVCKNVLSCDQMPSANAQEFKSLWRHVLCAIELAKANPSGNIRYQQNMSLIILEVLKNNLHVFTISEKSFLESFNSLSDDSQRLFARLYTRKGPWFRMSNISYPEISDWNEAIKALLEAGYICSFPARNDVDDNDLENVLNVLNANELREALRLVKKKCNQGTRKQDLVDSLLSFCKDGRPCLELQTFVLARTGACVRISPLADSLIWRVERLFFLNGEQDLSSFLLVDLGIVKYPAYNCIISEPIFSNRNDLLSYEESVEISQIMVESVDNGNSTSVLKCIEMSASRLSVSVEEGKSSSCEPKASFMSYFSAPWIYSKVILLGVSFLERDKRYRDAVKLLRQLLNTFISDGRRGYWTLRLSVDLEHMGCLEDSLQVAEEGLLDAWVRAGSKVALQRRVLRLGKPPRRWKVPSYSKFLERKIAELHIQGRPVNCKTGMKSVFYDNGGEQCGVEQLALQYYAGEGGGWLGVHTESGIWLTIFGILLWDIIFSDVPNVFRTKFQTSPLDLETDSFYEARKSLIEEQLERLQDGDAEEILITTWESHFGTSCRGVNWEKHALSDLRAAVACIGGAPLASICRHLAQDYRSWSSGMPDLLLWRLHDCYRGEAKLVEVKGPKDRLSEQQRAWLLVLTDCGFNVEVCKVSPAEI